MLCDEDLYRSQIERLRDLVEPLLLVVAEPSMPAAAATVLRHAPERFFLAGTSYGGSLALEVATTAPARVAGLWLMGTNPGPYRQTVERGLNARVQAGEFDALVDELAKAVVSRGGPHAIPAMATFRSMARRAGPTLLLRQNTALMERSDRRGDLSRISCPTLLVWGREDSFADVEHGHDMAARIPGARLVVLDGCGHLPTLERPEEATRAAREWLLATLLRGG